MRFDVLRFFSFREIDINTSVMKAEATVIGKSSDEESRPSRWPGPHGKECAHSKGTRGLYRRAKWVHNVSDEDVRARGACINAVTGAEPDAWPRAGIVSPLKPDARLRIWNLIEMKTKKMKRTTLRTKAFLKEVVRKYLHPGPDEEIYTNPSSSAHSRLPHIPPGFIFGGLPPTRQNH